jgi:hypothetical protein
VDVDDFLFSRRCPFLGPELIEDPVTRPDFPPKLFHASVAREQAGGRNFRFQINVIRAFFKSCLDLDRIDKPLVHTDFCGLHLQRTVMNSFGEFRDVNSKTAHTTPVYRTKRAIFPKKPEKNIAIRAQRVKNKLPFSCSKYQKTH